MATEEKIVLKEGKEILDWHNNCKNRRQRKNIRYENRTYKQHYE